MSTQNDVVLERLRKGPLTHLQAADELGVLRLAARVLDLRTDGHPIISRSITVRNRHGANCRVAEYSLEGKA